MKFVRILQASALAAAGALNSAQLFAEDAAAAAPAPATEPVAAPAVTDEQVFEAFGYLNGQGIHNRIAEMAKELNLSDAERALVLKGFIAALSGEEGKFNAEQFGPEIQRVLGGRQQAAQAKQSEAADAAAAGYFEELKKNPKILSTPSGLYYEIVQEGTGAKPTAEDTVKVHYTGKLIDGTVFDSSVERGEPVEFPLRGVIPGWTEGLQLVGAGGKLKLYIPGKLAYGPNPPPGSPITPNATLVFDVELLEIKGAAK